jgi:hypothetical protein
VAPYGFEVTKSVVWRGAEEFFSNVYHYDVTAGITAVNAEAILDALVAAEKPAFSSSVSFKQGRVWGRTDQGQAASQMVTIKDYTGSGTISGTTVGIPYELTLVVENYIGRGPAGRKQFLRKYLHVCAVDSSSSGAGSLGNGPLSGTTLAAGVSYWNRIKELTASSNQWKLCTKNGKPYDNIGSNPIVLPHLHTRQFRR